MSGEHDDPAGVSPVRRLLSGLLGRLPGRTWSAAFGVAVLVGAIVATVTLLPTSGSGPQRTASRIGPSTTTPAAAEPSAAVPSDAPTGPETSGSPGASGTTGPSGTAAPKSPSSPARTPSTPGTPESTAPSLPTLPSCFLEDPVVPRVRLLTFNIHGGIGPRGLDLRGVAEEIRSWDVDVVLLQEVDRGRARSRGVDQARQLGEWLGMHHVYAPLAPKKRGFLGNAVLSRFPIVDSGVTHLPFETGPKAERRGLLRATLDVHGQQLDVYNTHLQHTSARLRHRQMRAVRPVVTARGTPSVLGGDFNAAPGSPVLGVIRGDFVDVWGEAGAGPGHTAPARRPGHRIDYLMRDGSLSTLSASVMRTRISDHHAVRAELALPPIDACTAANGS